MCTVFFFKKKVLFGKDVSTTRNMFSPTKSFLFGRKDVSTTKKLFSQTKSFFLWRFWASVEGEVCQGKKKTIQKLPEKNTPNLNFF